MPHPVALPPSDSFVTEVFMHPPACRDAVPSVLVFILLTLIPHLLDSVAIADPSDRSPAGVVVLAQPTSHLVSPQITGSVRRPPTEAQPAVQSSRVGGQPLSVLLAQAAYGEAVAAPLPQMISEPILAPEPIRAPEPNGCGAEFGYRDDAGCGIEGCASCSGDLVGDLAGALAGGDALDRTVIDADLADGGLAAGWATAEDRGSAEAAGPAWLWDAGGAWNGSPADPCGGGPNCQAGCRPGAGDYLCLPLPRMCTAEFFGGVQGFSGAANYAGVGTEAADRRGSSSFGIHYGMNDTRPLALLDNQASLQLGIRGLQNDFAGADFTNNMRRQIFVTGGFFRRVDYGLQGGLVVDFLHDDWYYELNLAQLRGEISWRTAHCNEFGYGYMAGLSDDSSRTVIATGGGTFAADTIAMEAVNQNRLFYRRHFRGGGFAEAFAGFSGDDDGLLGASLELPLRNSFSLRSGATYLIPETSDEQRDHQEESWNLGISLVWYPCGSSSRYQRPLMNVADNGTFIVDRQ